MMIEITNIVKTESDEHDDDKSSVKYIKCNNVNINGKGGHSHGGNDNWPRDGGNDNWPRDGGNDNGQETAVTTTGQETAVRQMAIGHDGNDWS